MGSGMFGMMSRFLEAVNDTVGTTVNNMFHRPSKRTNPTPHATDIQRREEELEERDRQLRSQQEEHERQLRSQQVALNRARAELYRQRAVYALAASGKDAEEEEKSVHEEEQNRERAARDEQARVAALQRNAAPPAQGMSGRDGPLVCSTAAFLPVSKMQGNDNGSGVGGGGRGGRGDGFPFYGTGGRGGRGDGFPFYGTGGGFGGAGGATYGTGGGFGAYGDDTETHAAAATSDAAGDGDERPPEYKPLSDKEIHKWLNQLLAVKMKVVYDHVHSQGNVGPKYTNKGQAKAELLQYYTGSDKGRFDAWKQIDGRCDMEEVSADDLPGAAPANTASTTELVPAAPFCLGPSTSV